MKALILKNLQNDFLETGAIPLKDAETLIEDANRDMKKYEVVIALQKWFPGEYKKFAANHPWRKPGQTINIDEEVVVLQVIHCVAESYGAGFPPSLNVEKINYVIKDLGMGSDPILAEINRIVKEHKIIEIDVLGPEEPVVSIPIDETEV